MFVIPLDLQHFLFRELCAPLWQLVWIGTVARERTPLHPLDDALRDHARRIDPACTAILDRARSLVQFDECIVKVWVTDSWWAGASRTPSAYDAEAIAAMIINCSAPTRPARPTPSRSPAAAPAAAAPGRPPANAATS